MKKVLVTGGAGFIGSNLCDALLANDQYEVHCLDVFDDFYNPALKRNNILEALKSKNFFLHEGDIRNTTFLEKLFQQPFDIIVHLARLRDKSRKVVQIAEVGDCINGEIVLTPLFKFVENSQDKHGKVIGTLVRQNNVFNRTEKLKAAGFSEW